jgi:polysaccharide deacetylase family protein (PEP-CTERM system associated)
MKNALTIDLEDYFHATAFSAEVGAVACHSHVSRVERSTEKLLEILGQNGQFATFFTVGSVAENFPQLIQRIANAGHEIACHSYAHRLVLSLTRDQFYEDTRRAKLAIEDAAGTPVFGYRAPSFSITHQSEWAFHVLVELGFTYDSSVFPIRHLNFEMQHAPRDPFLIMTPAGSILELPMTTLQIAGARAPLAGGAYLRLLPYTFTRWGIRYLNVSEGRPACVYLHPWELDPEQPRMKGSITARMRHYFGLHSTESKLRRLLSDFEFQPLGLLAKELNSHLSPGPTISLPQVRLGEVCSYASEL